MKSDSGRGHRRKSVYVFVPMGIRENFDGVRNRVAKGWSREGKKLCKEEV